MDRPRQAVILAGGQGTRLKPLTDTCPKPMIPFHGRPFLEYLVDMLRDQGFQRLLLLLGYLPEQVIEHFGDGSRFGVAIDYAISPVAFETGARVREARDRLEDRFLLLYCDNYWPMDFDRMWRQYQEAGKPAQVTAYDNDDGYTRHNLIVGDDGTVRVYDKSRTHPGLEGVDIGFLILERAVVDLLPGGGNPSFEAEVYPKLIQRGELGAYRSGHRYYSVGSHERLHLTDAFLGRRRMVLLDRDGTLNKRMGRAEYVCSWDQWEWLPGAINAMAELTAMGYAIAIITNQPGIARGALTEDGLAIIHGNMIKQAEAAGAVINAVYHCPHNWNEGCGCRKPAPGMLFQAQREHHLDLTKTFFIGDDDRDGEAAAAAGSKWIKVSDEFPLSAAVSELRRLDHEAS